MRTVRAVRARALVAGVAGVAGLWLAAPGEAAAFCGTYVGGSGATLLNHTATVVMARQGTSTTLTLAMDYEGDASQFALLLPVPEVLTAEDVVTVDPALINKVAQYATPRMVSYTCDDVVPVTEVGVPACGFAMGCGGAADQGVGIVGYELDGAPLESSVEVEASFSVANYEIVVLSAEESADLQGWLGANGYAIPAGGETVLQEYIDGGAFFLAAKVTLDALEEGGQWLPPLQFSYESAAFSLPIRIGTISSPGEQEVVIYTITDSSAGAAGIANYPQVTVEDECMPLDGDDLAEVYPAALTEALGGEAGWVREHAWSLSQQCDPCTAPAEFTVEEMTALGYDGASVDHYGYNLGYLTALRVRYTPAQATQDLTLYTEGISDGYDTGYSYGTASRPEQTRYIKYTPEMEAFFPICGEGFVEDPATCWDEEEGGCSASGGASGIKASALGVGGPISSLAVLIALAIRRRNKEPR